MRTSKLKNGQIIPLTFDYVFTGIFNDENNIDIIENFISLYFDVPLMDIKGNVKIQSRNLPIDSKLEKNKQIDLLLDLNGEKINVELNNSNSKGIVDRNLIYISKIHGMQLKYKDNTYSNIDKTIQINFNNFSCNKDKLVESYFFTNNEGEILTKKLQIDIVDLEFAKQKRYNKTEEKLARFCLALTSLTIDELEESLGDIMEKESKDKLVDEVNKYSHDDEAVVLYSAYSRQELEYNTLVDERDEAVRNLKEAQKAAKETAKETAKDAAKEKQFEIARNLLDMNMSLEDIAKATSLSKKEIEKLKERIVH